MRLFPNFAGGIDPAALGWWHGGVPGLRPGDLLLSRSELPTWRDGNATVVRHPRAQPGHLDPSKTVSLTTDPFAALAYADDYRVPWEHLGRALRRPGTLYRVQPVLKDPSDLDDDTDRGSDTHPQVLHPDPDYPHHPKRFARTHRAVVLDVFQERVELSERDFVRHLAPYQRWQPGLPVYTETGHLLPSPSMQAAGATAATLADLGAWLPLSAVHEFGHPMRLTTGWRRNDEWLRTAQPRRDALMLPTVPLGRFGCPMTAIEDVDDVPATVLSSPSRRRGWLRGLRRA